MSTPYDDERIAAGSFCPDCGRMLENGATARDEPMFVAHAPAGHFFCGYCGAPQLESI